MECKWCNRKITNGNTTGFCSIKCANEDDQDYERYMNWYNDYMAGYDVPSFEKITRKPKRQEEA